MALQAIQGSHPLSRYGIRTDVRSYPRYYPWCTCKRHRVGFTDLSRLFEDGVATAPGNVTYPTRNFATLGILLA